MDELRFKLIAGPFGDETSQYEIISNSISTVKHFISEILLRKEWGNIQLIAPNGSIEFEYHHNKIIINQNDRSWLDLKIIEWPINAYGGWSRMDYILKVERNPQIDSSKIQLQKIHSEPFQDW